MDGASQSDSAPAGISEDADEYEDIIEQGSEAALEIDSRWLFKTGNEVFGPVTSKELLEKLYAGVISDETEIAPEDGDFMALRRYGAFRAHLPKAKEHLRALAEVKQKEAKAKSAAARRRITMVVVAAALCVGVFSITVKLIRDHRAEQVAKEAEAKLQGELDSLLASVTIEPPLLDVSDGEPEDPAKPTKGKRRRRRKGRAVARFTGGSGTGQLSRSEIMEGVGSVFSKFKKCIVRQIQQDPESVPERIMLTFTVKNNGTIKDVSLDDRILRRSPLMSCMRGTMAGLRYRSFPGEVRNVEYPITIGKR